MAKRKASDAIDIEGTIDLTFEDQQQPQKKKQKPSVVIELLDDEKASDEKAKNAIDGEEFGYDLNDDGGVIVVRTGTNNRRSSNSSNASRSNSSSSGAVAEEEGIGYDLNDDGDVIVVRNNDRRSSNSSNASRSSSSSSLGLAAKRSGSSSSSSSSSSSARSRESVENDEEIARQLDASLRRQDSGVEDDEALARKFHLETNEESLLHFYAAKGNIKDIVPLLELGKLNINQQNVQGNTPLLCAVLNSQLRMIELLAKDTTWSHRNNANKTFLDYKDYDGRFGQVSKLISRLALEAIGDPNADPANAWDAEKMLQNEASKPMDELMQMTGLRKVKSKILSLYRTFRLDLQRPEEKRVTNKQAMNFLFTGNPGNNLITFSYLDVCFI